jgi:hypothetical protein
MSRKTFLTISSIIALTVGLFALAAPTALLASKGVAPNAAAAVWVREVGILLLTQSVVGFSVRAHSDSPTLRAVLLANAVLQVGIFPIEILAYANGAITSLSGIVPNSILHVLLAAGFAWFYVDSGRARPAPASAIS